MSFFLLIDFLIFLNPYTFPCFFLIDIVLNKKISWQFFLSFFLFFDIFLLQTKGIFSLIVLFLALLSKLLKRKKRNPYFILTFLYFLFFILISFINNLSWKILMIPKTFTTIILLNFVLYWNILKKRTS